MNILRGSNVVLVLQRCSLTLCTYKLVCVWSLVGASSHQLQPQSNGGSAPAQCIPGLGGVRCWSGADGRQTAAMDISPRDSRLRCR